MDALLTRREFTATGAALATAVLPPLGTAATLAPPHAAPSTSHARTYIHLFHPGGWPATELWDPKPYTPLRPNMRGSDLLSTCESIPTSAPAIRLGAGLDALAPLMHRATIIRSLVDDEAQPHEAIDHAIAQQRMLDALTFEKPGSRLFRLNEDFHFGMDMVTSLTSHPTNASTKRFRVTLPFNAYRFLDTHESGARAIKEVKQLIAGKIAAMIASLDAQGRLDETIVCVSSEFSRTIAGTPSRGCDIHTGENTRIRSERDYGLHQHFAGSNSLILFGGPFQGGHVIGRTRDHHPMVVAEQPVTLAQARRMIAGALA
ncbi:MAG: DUF1501 domain-containing protein [Phycisphaeraceae bacterium]